MKFLKVVTVLYTLTLIGCLIESDKDVSLRRYNYYSREYNQGCAPLYLHARTASDTLSIDIFRPGYGATGDTCSQIYEKMKSDSVVIHTP